MDTDAAREFSEAFGQIGAGWWRQVAWAHQQGIPAALGLTTEQWVAEYVGGHVRLSTPDRREAVAELTAEGMSTREIGGVLGVGKSTVERDLSGPDGPPAGSDAADDAAPDTTPGPDGPPPPDAYGADDVPLGPPPAPDPALARLAERRRDEDAERRMATDAINGAVARFWHPAARDPQRRAEHLWAHYDPRSRRWPDLTVTQIRFAAAALAAFADLAEADAELERRREAAIAARQVRT